MQYSLLKTSPTYDRFILSTSDYSYCHENNTPNTSHFDFSRNLSLLGSSSYSRSLRRAFSRAKLLAFFNPDLNQFITLTYKQQNNTISQVQSDIKKFIRYQRKYLNKTNVKKSTSISPQKSQKSTQNTINQQVLKYIYVLEYQKRGSIHVHMLANDVLSCERNSNGYLSVKGWSSGFTSIKQLSLAKFDASFKSYLYLFKYMTKAQRIGSSFIHTSRNFDKISFVDYDSYINYLAEGDILYKEDYSFTIEDRHCTLHKTYFNYKET